MSFLNFTHLEAKRRYWEYSTEENTLTIATGDETYVCAAEDIEALQSQVPTPLSRREENSHAASSFRQFLQSKGREKK